MQTIFSAHITHKSAGLDQMEAIGGQEPVEMLHDIMALEGVKECALLKTCNRVEIYTVTEEYGTTRKKVEEYINGFIPFNNHENLVQFLTNMDSVRHLLRVSSGLESMIIGEDQIQMQVKESFDRALHEKCLGPVLSLVFRKSISVGKKVRTETGVNKGCVSIGSAAVEMAESKLGSLKNKNVLVIGAGEMATLIAKHLIGKGPETVFVSNRTYSRAVELAWALNGKAIRFDALNHFLAQSDVVLVATSASHMVLEKRHLESAMSLREQKGPMLVIDVSFPRNVSLDIQEVPDVQLYDIDGLRDVAQENVMRRKSEMRSAERIISEELDLLDRSLEEMRAGLMLSRLYRKFNEIREREVIKASNRLASGEDAHEVIDDFARSLMNRFLADPTEVIKCATRNGDDRLLDTTMELFKIEGDVGVSGVQTEKIADECHGSGDGP
ncbi:MAG TPA: glutamyl-tRNA reductase [Methanomassiliicoccales archaeon]